MKNRIITISREFGSGGRTIGRQTAEALHLPCYDQELIEKISEKSGFTREFVREKGEYTTYGSWFANALSDRTAGGVSTQDYLWTIQRNTILELAEQGPCVIVGRCAELSPCAGQRSPWHQNLCGPCYPGIQRPRCTHLTDPSKVLRIGNPAPYKNIREALSRLRKRLPKKLSLFSCFPNQPMEMVECLGSSFLGCLGMDSFRIPSSYFAETSSGSTSPT